MIKGRMSENGSIYLVFMLMFLLIIPLAIRQSFSAIQDARLQRIKNQVSQLRWRLTSAYSLGSLSKDRANPTERGKLSGFSRDYAVYELALSDKQVEMQLRFAEQTPSPTPLPNWEYLLANSVLRECPVSATSKRELSAKHCHFTSLVVSEALIIRGNASIAELRLAPGSILWVLGDAHVDQLYLSAESKINLVASAGTLRISSVDKEGAGRLALYSRFAEVNIGALKPNLENLLVYPASTKLPSQALSTSQETVKTELLKLPAFAPTSRQYLLSIG